MRQFFGDPGETGGLRRDGCDDTQPHRQRYRCKGCASRFDDLTGTVLAGHHQPPRVWVLCLYFMGLNLSSRQIAGELGLAVSDVQAMTEQLRRGLGARVPTVELKGAVEIDEVYAVAGHKGQPEEAAKRRASAGAAGWDYRKIGGAEVGWIVSRLFSDQGWMRGLDVEVGEDRS